MPYYAVARGFKPGVYLTWEECKVQVDGFSRAKYKKFQALSEAEQFVYGGCGHQSQSLPFIQDSESRKITDFFKSNNNSVLGTSRTLGYESDDSNNSVYSLNVTAEKELYIYTDGACSNNGRRHACAGIGVYFGQNDSRNVSRRIDGKQTNNAAELEAIIEALRIVSMSTDCNQNITIVSDSEYSIRCATTYGDKCAKKGFKTTKKEDIPNRVLVERLYNFVKNFERGAFGDRRLNFMHCMAHTNKTDIHSMGNDAADKLANKAIGVEECPYLSPEYIK